MTTRDRYLQAYRTCRKAGMSRIKAAILAQQIANASRR